MRHLFSTRIRVILILAILLTAGLAILSSVSGDSIPHMVVQGIMTPLRAAGNALTKTAEQYYSYMFNYEALAAENAALKEQIAQMEDVAREADFVARENARLRDLIELNANHEDYKEVDAYIIAWNSTDWNSTFTINRGTNAGIAVDMCVITENGEVVGLVTEVGPNYAVVKTVLDSTLEISATIADSGYKGMVSGGYIWGKNTILKMEYLPSDSIIRNKEQVVTSGSTVYPRGLILGRVVDAGNEDTGVAKYALLQPAAEIDSLEQVFVITEYNTTGLEPGSADTSGATEPTTPAE